MLGPKELAASLDGFEIGATGPGTLQFVLQAQGRAVTLMLTAEEARWLAYSLTHWAEESEGITKN